MTSKRHSARPHSFHFIGRFYSIRHKFVLLNICFLLLSLLVVIGNYAFFIHPMIRHIEQDAVERRVFQSGAMLLRELDALAGLGLDRASWDELYEHMLVPNRDFISENFKATALHDLRLDLILILGPQPRVYEKALSPAAEASGLATFADQLPAMLHQLPALLALNGQPLTVSRGFSGLLNTPAGPMMLTAQPIRHSDHAGPLRGVLLLGRLLVKSYLSELQTVTGVDFQIQPIPNPGILDAVSLNEFAVGHGHLVLNERKSGTVVAGFDLLDINHQPSFRFAGQVQSRLYVLGDRTLGISVLFCLVTFGVVFTGFILTINRIVIDPLHQLDHYVTRVRQHNDFIAEPKLAEDEIGSLARAFTALMDDLLLKQRDLSLQTREDGLTKVANRRWFDESLPLAVRHAWQRQLPLSLIMIDIDYFKGYNDQYGHVAGDQVLRQIANVLQNGCDARFDLVARYGGEEFVILLRGRGVAEAAMLAQQLQQRVEAQGIPHIASRCARVVTLSCGVASMVPQTENDDKLLLLHADEALYHAKGNGRNRVEIYQAPLPELITG